MENANRSMSTNGIVVADPFLRLRWVRACGYTHLGLKPRRLWKPVSCISDAKKKKKKKKKKIRSMSKKTKKEKAVMVAKTFINRTMNDDGHLDVFLLEQSSLVSTSSRLLLPKCEILLSASPFCTALHRVSFGLHLFQPARLQEQNLSLSITFAYSRAPERVKMVVCTWRPTRALTCHWPYAVHLQMVSKVGGFQQGALWWATFLSPVFHSYFIQHHHSHVWRPHSTVGFAAEFTTAPRDWKFLPLEICQ